MSKIPKYTVFMLFCLLVCFLPVNAQGGAFFYLSFDKESYFDPEYLEIDLLIKSPDDPINALNARVQFDTSKLEIVESGVATSTFPFVLEENYDNTTGFYNLYCGTHLATSSNAIQIAHLKFKKLAAGQAFIKFRESSQVLAADGFGTNILTSRDIHYINIVK